MIKLAPDVKYTAPAPNLEISASSLIRMEAVGRKNWKIIH